MFLKTNNTEFNDIIKRFTDQNGKPLDKEVKILWYCLLTNRNGTLQNQEQEITLKDIDFSNWQESIHEIRDMK